ncbi:hypothetical protein L226DRAFT_340021 [Lentinus tigrinus ALCF2SS1-7]|uniref:Uncharacterized protein n=1 Tax=Lentinus tigrinus ALCF2SS1-6 TaxID=1328759 RepID=A0A5C2RSE3_9APHY|nr:hypothetical protein L227DRAFT_400874 [Lentinus tigrinus ALCF2SS1-6]RPD68576.1 hypothetical protein L226DRAFT_340021 [Lentinus tigrinus ALCF2SS1-7]
MVPDTDFPDIRCKCAIHSHNGSGMIVPREGYLFRLYIQLSDRDAVDPHAACSGSGTRWRGLERRILSSTWVLRTTFASEWQTVRRSLASGRRDDGDHHRVCPAYVPPVVRSNMHFLTSSNHRPAHSQGEEPQSPATSHCSCASRSAMSQTWDRRREIDSFTAPPFVTRPTNHMCTDAMRNNVIPERIQDGATCARDYPAADFEQARAEDTEPPRCSLTGD